MHFAHSMLSELLYTIQWDGDTPLHVAVQGDHITCAERLLSTPGIDINIKNKVSWSVQSQTYMQMCALF